MPCVVAVFFRKNVSPTEQVAGRFSPVLNGFVETAPEKSTFLVCVLRSTLVCVTPTAGRSMANAAIFKFMVIVSCPPDSQAGSRAPGSTAGSVEILKRKEKAPLEIPAGPHKVLTSLNVAPANPLRAASQR
jgi:hypothetical protein